MGQSIRPLSVLVVDHAAVRSPAMPLALPHSLRRQGDLLWRALLRDLRALPGVEVAMTSRLDAVPASDPPDAVWPLALESGGVLECLSRAILRDRCILLGSLPDTVAITASKLALTRVLAAGGVATVATCSPQPLAQPQPQARHAHLPHLPHLASLHDSGQHDSGQHDSSQHDSDQHDSGQHDSGQHHSDQHDSGQHHSDQHHSDQYHSDPYDSGAWVVKPDDGAGCLHTRLFRDRAAALAWIAAAAVPGFVLQPFVAGRPGSLSLLCCNGEARVLACNQERVAMRDNRFHALGSVVNGLADDDGALARLAAQVTAALPGLWGYVGVSFVLGTHGAVVLDVNPRLTVAYAGLHASIGRNPAAMVLDLLAGHGALPAPGLAARRPVSVDVGS